MDPIPLFKDGDLESILSAEERNKRIVRPLNKLLAMIAKPPFKLVKAESGWILSDTRAKGDAGNQPYSVPIIPSPACAIPDLSDAIGVVVTPEPYEHCGGEYPDGTSQGAFDFCVINGMTESCTYTFRIYIDAVVPTSGSVCSIFADADLVYASDAGGTDCGGILKSGEFVDIEVAGENGGFFLLFFCPAGSHISTGCYAEIIDIELLSSTP